MVRWMALLFSRPGDEVMDDLTIDPERHAETMDKSPDGRVTGIMVRAKIDGKWGGPTISSIWTARAY